MKVKVNQHGWLWKGGIKVSCNITGHCACYEEDGAFECCICGMTRDDEYDSDWADDWSDVETPTDDGSDEWNGD